MEAVPRFSEHPWTLIVFDRIPSEISIQSVYFPPFFFTVVFGFVCTLVIAKLLNVTGLGQFFWYPGLAFVALWVLLTSLIGLLVIPP
jgi:hypothetical protein